MDKKAPSPSPEKMGNVAPQQDADVMALIERKGQPKQPDQVAKAKNDLRRIIKQVGIDPQRVIQAGKYAEAALKDPSLYPMAIQNAVQAGLLTEEQVPKEPGINWQLLAQGYTAGKLTEELVKEGAI